MEEEIKQLQMMRELRNLEEEKVARDAHLEEMRLKELQAENEAQLKQRDQQIRESYEREIRMKVKAEMKLEAADELWSKAGYSSSQTSKPLPKPKEENSYSEMHKLKKGVNARMKSPSAQ